MAMKPEQKTKMSFEDVMAEIESAPARSHSFKGFTDEMDRALLRGRERGVSYTVLGKIFTRAYGYGAATTLARRYKELTE